MSLIPSNQTIYGNLNVSGAITSFTNQVPTDPFGDIRVVHKQSYLNLKSTFGVSALRDLVTGTGTVSNTLAGLGGTGEYQMSVTAANDTVSLQSQERGSYVAGFGAEVGMGVRVPVAPTGTTVARWGLFDSMNGMYYHYSSSGIAVGMVRGGVETVVPRSSWNVDKLDGTGPSGYTIDLARGNIFQMVFSWYGYGAINFRVVCTDSNGNQLVQVVHRGVVPGMTSMTTPNLPITASITQGATASAFSIFVAGRSYCILGSYPQRTRRVSVAYTVASGAATKTAFYPLISVRRKPGYLGNSIEIHNVELSMPTDSYYEIRVNATLGGTASNYVNLPSTLASETALQQDTSATTVTGGIVLYAGNLPLSDSRTETDQDEITYKVEETQVVTVCVRVSPTGGNNASYVATCFLRFLEYW